MKLQTGIILQRGKYKVERMVGQGRFGQTYLGTDMSTGRPVTIFTVFLQNDKAQGEAQKIFRQEYSGNEQPIDDTLTY